MSVWFDKNRERWRYDFTHAGIRYARECVDDNGAPATSRRAAMACETSARQVAKLAPKLPRANDLTIAQVVNSLSEGWTTQKQWENKRRYAREVIAYFGAAKMIREIDEAMVADFVLHLKRQPVMIWRGAGRKPTGAPGEDRLWRPTETGRTRSNATVNRYLPVLREIFDRAAKTRDPVTGEPAIRDVPKVPDLEEPKRKPRPVPEPVLQDLMQIIPDHLVDAIKITLYFGLRKGEVFGLRTRHVDFHARGIWFTYDEVKDKEDAFLPGGRDAMQLLARLVDQARERGIDHLIAYRRTRKSAEDQANEPWRAMKNPRRAWRTAMKKVQEKYGKDWRWHDMRAAFITHIAITCGSIPAQKLARHSLFETTQAYIEVGDEVLRNAAEQAGARPFLKVVDGGS